MATPDPTPDTELDAQELTDENLDEVSGGVNLTGTFTGAALTAPAAVASQTPLQGTDAPRLF